MPTLARTFVLVLALCAIVAGGAYWYTQAAVTRMIAACKGSDACYQDLLFDRIETQGLSRGWSLLERIYEQDPSFRAHCHGFAVEAAQEAYGRYPDHASLDMGPSLALCNYGFLQEYPQEVLLATKDEHAAQAFCQAVASALGSAVPGAEAECWRGVGRGLPLMSDPKSKQEVVAAAQRAITACDRLVPDETSRRTCYSGVFNILGREAVAAGEVDTEDPVWLCKLQTELEARNRCFGNYKATAVSLVDMNDAAVAGEDLLRLYGEQASTSVVAAMWTIGYERARTRLVADLAFMEEIEACAALPAPFERSCIRGISVGLAKHGRPWMQHLAVGAFCAEARAMMPQLALDDCPSDQALGFIRGLHSPEAFAAIYAGLEEQLGGLIPEAEMRTFGY